jgi:hypothetical protein
MAIPDTSDAFTPEADPIDSFDQLFSAQGWTAERAADDEIYAVVPGSWRDYQLRCLWRPDERVVQLVCMLDAKAPDAKRLAIYEALGLINERVWIGHFEMWAEDGDLLFRHAAFVDSEAGLSPEHAELLVQAAVSECERFYPVFQFILWAGKKPAEAMEAALLETVGEA